MSLATLRYERAAPKTNESKQGIPIFDGTPAGFYEWEVRSMTRYQATDEEDRWKLASKLYEGLTGESLKVAMALGIDKLSQKDSVLKLVEALRPHMFNSGNSRGQRTLPGRTTSWDSAQTSWRAISQEEGGGTSYSNNWIQCWRSQQL